MVFVYFLFPIVLFLLSSVCLVFSPYLAFLPIFWLIIIIPFLDLFVSKMNLRDSELCNNYFYDFALIIVLPFVVYLIFFGLYIIDNRNYSISTSIALGFSVGVSIGTVGISAAHELIHRSTKWMRAFGVIILAFCFYAHFRIEHIYGHHLNVGTRKDPATARKGENAYFFIFRCILMTIVSSINIESKRMRSNGSGVISWQNRIVQYLFFSILFIVLTFYFVGWEGVVFIVVQAFIAVMLLETTEYIEHYGLQRISDNNGRYESFKTYHAWNSRHSVACWTTFNLGLHSDHHKNSSKNYSLLSQDKREMEMPLNPANMIILALIPPFWFYLMDKRLSSE